MKKFICKLIVFFVEIMTSMVIGHYFGVLIANYPEDIDNFKSQFNDTIGSLIKDAITFRNTLKSKKIKGLEYELSFSYSEYLYSIMNQIREGLA